MLSEPHKYLGTHIMFFVGMLLFYTCAAQYQYWLPLLLTVLLHLAVLFTMFKIAFKDPGIIPKILPDF